MDYLQTRELTDKEKEILRKGLEESELVDEEWEFIICNTFRRT